MFRLGGEGGCLARPRKFSSIPDHYSLAVRSSLPQYDKQNVSGHCQMPCWGGGKLAPVEKHWANSNSTSLRKSSWNFLVGIQPSYFWSPIALSTLFCQSAWGRTGKLKRYLPPSQAMSILRAFTQQTPTELLWTAGHKAVKLLPSQLSPLRDGPPSSH